jgi:hypothetical protein
MNRSIPAIFDLRNWTRGGLAPEDSFDVVAVRVEHEIGVVTYRITHRGVP